MLKRLQIKNFTVFAEANFEFGPGLNVVVGTNGTGKSHVLKLGYAIQQAYVAAPHSVANVYKPTKMSDDIIVLSTALSRIQEVFLAYKIQQLVRRSNLTANPFPSQTRVSAALGADGLGSLEFSIDGKTGAIPDFEFVAQPINQVKAMEKPVFIPAKEMLSLMPNILGLIDKYMDLLDSTYTDLARSLVVPLLKNLPTYAQEAIDSIGTLLQGRIESENGRFYLAPQHGGERFEINLVAEGYRKMGTLVYLLANGSLTPETTLFWDEPEANLNPALLKKLAAVLTELARQGFQIILATHSLFLLNELHILAQNQQSTVRYFGLYQGETGETKVEQTDDLETLNHLVALDEELAQTVRFQRVLDGEYSGKNSPAD